MPKGEGWGGFVSAGTVERIPVARTSNVREASWEKWKAKMYS